MLAIKSLNNIIIIKVIILINLNIIIIFRKLLV